ncbi:FAD binding domain-containing protein [Hirsutella rhossiliensis]|uniref:FAD binding domain-containing protein n=1 Tax=Hirsutella rhossiliensis TaxID=111463 RepID=A0A9P8MLN3_9HYPO|nr:FAD binding domain-containing protein [Hirsutella rhossiliensis]KAH0957415.1 FAD binding domain-containing protein [Hirsutella rhossiliensis]
MIAAAPSPPLSYSPPPPDCHHLPGDPGWPGPGDWDQLNRTVGGRLIAGRSLASRCHGPGYDREACGRIQEAWTKPATYFDDPVHVMAPYWLNSSCSPFTAPNASCSLGNMASYAVRVGSAHDVAAGFKFARDHNIRVTVKNTGHDFIGRSAGRGSLALWTHHLKAIEFLDYSGPRYRGPAVRVGAGVQFFELYRAAARRGLRVAGGYCPTVGIAGGYVQGAGHGPLGATYGLAADNTLEFEVVTTGGRRLAVSPSRHPDLFWALSGGGGGTYAVVVSATVKAHPDGRVAGASLTIRNDNDDAFWSAVGAWHRHLLVLDRIPGFTTAWGVTNTTFSIQPATWSGADAASMAAVLGPFLQELRALNVTPVAFETSDNATFYDHYVHYTDQMPYGPYPTNDIIGGRLIPRSAVRHNLAGLVAALRAAANSSRLPSIRINGIAANVTRARSGTVEGSNAVLPAWRDSLYWLNTDVVVDPASPPAELRRIQTEVNRIQDTFRRLTPRSGAYANEATFDNPNWKADYYGRNYDRLLAVKRRYDPSLALYAHTSVGSDGMTVAADGRLCKARHIFH